MNAASADILFPSDKLRVLEVTEGRSVMTMWVQKPAFSNTAAGGYVNFAGIVLNPGFTGTAGNVMTIRFQALATGDAPLSMVDGSILANDGSGTNILDSLGTGDITVIPAVPTASSSQAVSGQGSSTKPIATSTPPLPPSLPPTSWYNSSPGLLLIVFEIALLLLVTALVIVIAWYVKGLNRNSSAGAVAQDRKELHDDLVRIERELAEGQIGQQETLKKEISHLEDDMKKE
jgi:hypothetical protein